MSGVCDAGHGGYDGKSCWPCYKQKRRAQRAEAAPEPRLRKPVPGEPEALILDDDWRADASCRFPPHGLDADDWFTHRQSLEDRTRIAQVKAVCFDCPVRQPCLDYALATRQPWGVWGGTTADERAKTQVRVKQRREQAMQ